MDCLKVLDLDLKLSVLIRELIDPLQECRVFNFEGRGLLALKKLED